MQIRIVAGCNRLMVALAAASLIFAPAGAATPLNLKGDAGSNAPTTAGKAGTAKDDLATAPEPELFKRSNYVWPFSTGPVYGGVDASRWSAAGVLHTDVGSFDLTQGLPNFPSELRVPNKLGSAGTQYFLLQVRPEAFTDGAFDAMKGSIVAQGGSVVGEIPIAAFLVRMTPGAFAAIKDSQSIIALQPYQPAFKLSPEIGRTPLPDPAKAASNVYSLTLRLFPGEDSAVVAKLLTAMGLKVTGRHQDTLFVDADRTKLAQIARLEPVMRIVENVPTIPLGEEGTTTIQTGKWNNGATPYTDAGVDGGGSDKALQSDDQILMIIDTGIQIDAGDLSHTRTDAGLDVNLNPIAGHRKVAFYGTTTPFAGKVCTGDKTIACLVDQNCIDAATTGPCIINVTGDLLGCDSPTTSGTTHGHTVAAIALGNATKVPVAYGVGWTATDTGGNPWGLDGVAPKARLVAYDAMVTPLTGRCDDPKQIALDNNFKVGDLFSKVCSLSATTSCSSDTDCLPSNGFCNVLVGSLPDGYAKGARVVSFSWGKVAPAYDDTSLDIDQFLLEKQDSMIFIAAGNSGRDKNNDRVPDPGTIGPPGTAKNGITVGTSRYVDDLGDPDAPNGRWSQSSNGGTPLTPSGDVQRIAPLLMAPGSDPGTTGLTSEFSCRTNDNSQVNPVECDVLSGGLSSSWAAAHAAGAGLLVRDFFAQGFYPDGTSANPSNASDKVANISGALLKALLVASADWMNQPGDPFVQRPTNAPWGASSPDFYGFTGNLSRKYRGNREQGFGAIQLKNVLPLQTYSGSVSGLIIGDGGGVGFKNDTTLNLKIDPNKDSRTCALAPLVACTLDSDCSGGATGPCSDYKFNVCDTTQPLTVVISFIDPSLTTDISRDLNLQLTSPSARVYLGNFFTDDVNDDAAITGSEDCTFTSQPWPPPPAFPGILLDTGPWSLPSNTCTAGIHVDHLNNVEAIFLSPDSRLNGIADDPATTATNEASDNQIEQGAWTVKVVAEAANSAAQSYSIAIAGGLCDGDSAVRVQKVLPNNQAAGSSLGCNDSAVVTVDEIGTTGLDPLSTLTASEVSSRTKLEVVDSANVIWDTETFGASDFSIVGSCPNQRRQCTLDADCTSFGGGSCVLNNANNIRFDSKKILLSENTTPNSGNGVLDVRSGQFVRATYQDESPFFAGTPPTPNLDIRRIGVASVKCQPAVASGGVVFGQFGKDAFTLLSGGCEQDARGYFTFGFPDRYMDAGELIAYAVAFQSAEVGATLLNVSISLDVVLADSDSPATCRPGTTPGADCADPNRTNNVSATTGGSKLLEVLDTPKVIGVLPPAQTVTPRFTIKLEPDAAFGGTTKSVDMLIGVTSATAGKSVKSIIAKRETLNADEFAFFYSTDFPTGGSEPVGGWDINSNERLENVTSDPQSFTNDYIFETQSYSDMTVGGFNDLSIIKVPWNFDTNDGGFVGGLQNSSRPGIVTIAQWGEDRNYNGKIDGFCSLNNSLPCTKDGGISEACFRCSLDLSRECNNNADCAVPPAAGTCNPQGSCLYSLGEDRDPSGNNALDTGWSTAGGCGWQTKDPGATFGGVWHTGLIGDASQSIPCLLSGSATTRCQTYEAVPDGDLVGDNNWWELLQTPVLNKVNRCPSVSGNCPRADLPGDPTYQIAITDWSWNMLVDIPDENTTVRLEFDTDISKVAGAELYNDAGFTNGFAGKQGAISGGNPPITNGFNMFAKISKCVDTDGDGNPDHCGTAAGEPCSDDNLCTGKDLTKNRGLCSIAPAQKVCSGGAPVCNGGAGAHNNCSIASCNGTAGRIPPCGPRFCTINADCTTPSTGTCIQDFKVCETNADCDLGTEGTCTLAGGNNREAKNNCAFEGKISAGAKTRSLEPFGLATPMDDDIANGYCLRSDSLSVTDKSITCITNLECANAGTPYTTCEKIAPFGACSQRVCSLANTVACTSNAGCTGGQGVCSVLTCSSTPDCTSGGAAGGTCTLIDEYVQRNGPGRNYKISDSNGPDMRFTTLEDFYGDTGLQFRAVVGFNIREPDADTDGVAPGFGVALDDMVIAWKETRLDVDTHNCAGSGECATLESSNTTSYEGNSVLNLTVTDSTPYDPVNNENNCNDDSVCSLSTSTSCVLQSDCTRHCSLLTSKLCTTNADCTLATEGTCVGTANGTCVQDYSDAGDSDDCNGNGKKDVTVKVFADSPSEFEGEIAVLDQVSPGSPVYKTAFPYSTLFNSPNSLFVVQVGTTAPIIRARYEDRWDGVSGRCKNFLDPTQQGFLFSNTAVNVTVGRVAVQKYTLTLVGTCSVTTTKLCTVANQATDCPAETCNITGRGDDDGFADTNETLNLAVTFANKSGVDLDDLTATLGTTDPNVECVNRSFIAIGSLQDKQLSNPANYLPFQFKMGSVNRSTVNQVLQATFSLTIRSSKFDALTRSLGLTLDLDLNATGGGGKQSFIEDFESASTFGKFTLDTLDKNLATVKLSDDYRCQYNDPFLLNSNSPGNVDCFLGFPGDNATVFDNEWHIHKNNSANGSMGRAYTGSQSLHLGFHRQTSSPIEDTYTVKQLDAIKTYVPINMPLTDKNVELYFAQQVSFVDVTSGVNVTSGESVERGVVELQLVDSAGVSVGNWIKIYPFENEYDQQGTDDFSNCTFDPVDDGNDEDSFFDPADPLRRLGPSSTCYPEFVFVRQGQTDYRKTFDVTDIGAASDGPGLEGCTDLLAGTGCLLKNGFADESTPDPTIINNPGTWVMPKFALVGYSGRRIQLRFVFTGIELGTTRTMYDFFGRGNINGDDGWYVDGIHIDEALSAPLTLVSDGASITAIPCGTCTGITPVLTATPSSVPPGQIVTLEAKNSSLNAGSSCSGGVLQYQFWTDNKYCSTTTTQSCAVSSNCPGVETCLAATGIAGDTSDTLLRDWTDSSTFLDVPQLNPTVYGMRVRCSTDTACGGTGAILQGSGAVSSVAVPCPPSTGTPPRAPFGLTLFVNKSALSGAEPDNVSRLTWGATNPGYTPNPAISISVDAFRGGLSGSTAGTIGGVVLKPTPPVAVSTFTGTEIDEGATDCMATNTTATFIQADQVLANTPTSATTNGWYFLVRGQTTTYCNETGPGYTTTHPKERGNSSPFPVGRDAQIDGAPALVCP